MPVVSMKHLLEAGVHFGHQTRRWNPKMKPYIFTDRNGIHIFDLQKTLKLLEESYIFVRSVVESGNDVLFVGTKKQAQESVVEEAMRCGMPYVSNRWLGGTLTNFKTINKRIARLRELEQMQEDGTFEQLPKKEVIQLRHELDKLKRNHTGIRDMKKVPACVFIVDPKKEDIAIREARRLGIPIVAIVDTNCDPDEVDYIIPGNDDAIRAVAMIVRIIADAAVEGREMRPTPESAAEVAQSKEELGTMVIDEPVKATEKDELKEPEAKEQIADSSEQIAEAVPEAEEISVAGEAEPDEAVEDIGEE